jgi:hypothetical protein
MSKGLFNILVVLCEFLQQASSSRLVVTIVPIGYTGIAIGNIKC